MRDTILRITNRARRTRLVHALQRMKKRFNILALIARSARRFQRLRVRPRAGIHVSEKMKRPFPAWTMLTVLLLGAGLGYFVPIAVNVLTGTAQSNTPDFTMGLSPASTIVPQGGFIAVTVSMNSLNGFAGSVSLNATTSPGIANSTLGLNPSSSSLLTGTGSAVLSITMPNNAPVGSYSLKITGTSGRLTHAVTEGLRVTVPAPPDFQIQASPPSITIVRGSADSGTITLMSVGGFSGVINIGASVSPSSGTSPTLSLSPNRVTLLSGGTANVLLTISTTGTTAVGTYSVVVQGLSGTLSNTVTITAVVQ